MTATALFTVLYELTMLDAHHSLGMAGIAVFSLFVRKLPPERSFLSPAGSSCVKKPPFKCAA
ncbi:MULTISPECIES: hypothetical protein [unclassified Ensifer]|uniref:hypothetical protein n=1 Tax=unclassified Ensifer TaxID=2633371 RepID=UPI00070AD7FD|nr:MULTISPECIES: hypothetical protein [unclassified Ensifer]KQW51060.1 hypothetical protein ASD02_32545 [Ensifer sp. Root1252]KRC54310.1 hypothetical protein ASE32_22595 [Ensifer sp. Root231]KRD01644.1 hypothetical protein ASE47_21970 [Ensifer sp. Root258]